MSLEPLYNEQPLEACDQCKVLMACISFTKEANSTGGSRCSNPPFIHQEQSTHDSAVLDSSQSNNASPKSNKKRGILQINVYYEGQVSENVCIKLISLRFQAKSPTAIADVGKYMTLFSSLESLSYRILGRDSIKGERL